MKGLARLDLINEIATELQARLTTTEINVFLAGYGIAHEDTTMVPSKRIYARDLIAKVPLSMIIAIAADLDIEIPTALQQQQEKGDMIKIETDYPVEIRNSLERYVALEVGYIMALRKPVCLLKDKTLKALPTDLVDKLYRVFDPQDPQGTIPDGISKCLIDRQP